MPKHGEQDNAIGDMTSKLQKYLTNLKDVSGNAIQNLRPFGIAITDELELQNIVYSKH